eukprot:TRINITY_DN826_c0_g1_i1.p1 TRINITY_DN826_c0_g1~~TRINITY_DN826_c0_g1_i1.p1  ORF type:complete len:328 (-),score=65.24 TRINITY_DN826_c0_g1_i1:90-1073(-)
MLKIIVKWKKDNFETELSPNQTYGDLKSRMYELTKVHPDRQKWMGIVGKSFTEESTLESMKIKPTTKLMMMGNPEEDIAPVDIPEDSTVDDMVDIEPDEIETKDQQVYLDKIQTRIKSYKPFELSKPITNKKLLVLDVDYTFFDHCSSASNPLVLRRPYINFMLETVYPFYDIIIWSATSMKWIELKMKELQIVTSKNFNITAYFDYNAMITVHTEKYGVYNTKPLPVIWGIYPEHYNQKNTIMFDDLGRNFIMNPGNGLKIRPFKNAPVVGQEDEELLHLTFYLLLIKDEPDLSALSHKKWERYIEKRKEDLLNIQNQIKDKIKKH